MKTRIIQTDFWRDDDILQMSLCAQHLYMFLLTCPEINMCGIFKISSQLIAALTKMTSEQLNSAKAELEQLGKVYWCKDWVFVKNARSKNNYENSPKNVQACQKELNGIPQEIKDYFQKLTGVLTSIPVPTTSDTSIDSSIHTNAVGMDTNHNHNQNQKGVRGVGEGSAPEPTSKQYPSLDDVGEAEITKIAVDYRVKPALVRDVLDTLRNKIAANPQKYHYEDYYSTLRSWVKNQLNFGTKDPRANYTSSLFDQPTDNPDLARQAQISPPKHPISEEEILAMRAAMPEFLQVKIAAREKKGANAK